MVIGRAPAAEAMLSRSKPFATGVWAETTVSPRRASAALQSLQFLINKVEAQYCLDAVN